MHFVDTLVGGVLVELVDLAEGEEYGVVGTAYDTQLIVCDYEFDLIVFAFRQLAENVLIIVQHRQFAFFYFILLESKILKSRQFLQAGVPAIDDVVPGIGNKLGSQYFFILLFRNALNCPEANHLI